MRFELGGEGLAIPIEALPIPSEDGDLPPQTLLLPTGNFLKQDYVGLGYTHFEAWCIGAVGGRGGTLLFGHYGYAQASRYYGGAGGGGGLHHISGLLADLADATPVVVGQAGLNGADNPGPAKWILPASYGTPGVDTFPGENLAIVDTGARPLTRGGHTYINADGSYVGTYTKIDVMGNPVPSNYNESGWVDAPETPWLGHIPGYSYIVMPNPAYVVTQDALNGGYSSFGDVCKASGGKGGKRAPMYSVGVNVGVTDERWEQYHRFPEDDGWYSSAADAEGGRGLPHPGGDGGEGGIGGRTLAGGGGAGGSHIQEYHSWGESTPGVTAGDWLGYTEIPPQDGTWDGDIGSGGGGGHGGGYYPTQYNGNGSVWTNATVAPGQNGGQGAFNYGDTSKYGPRQNRDADPYNGKPIVPGTGGGAKFNPLQMYGGRAVGSNPNGAVLIRIVKLS